MTLEDLEFQSARIAEAGYPLHDQETVNIARALLAILPVYRAAVEWRDHGPGQSHCEEEDCPCTSAVCQLKSAIDKLRREMEE